MAEGKGVYVTLVEGAAACQARSFPSAARKRWNAWRGCAQHPLLLALSQE